MSGIAKSVSPKVRNSKPAARSGKRRHLNTSQKIALGVDIEPHFAAEAKKRMQARKGNQPGASKANVPYLVEGKAQARAQRVRYVGLLLMGPAQGGLLGGPLPLLLRELV